MVRHYTYISVVALGGLTRTTQVCKFNSTQCTVASFPGHMHAALKSDIGDNVRNDTKSPSKVRKAKTATAQHSKLK